MIECHGMMDKHGKIDECNNDNYNKYNAILYSRTKCEQTVVVAVQQDIDSPPGIYNQNIYILVK